MGAPRKGGNTAGSEVLQEIELKLQVSARLRATVQAEVAQGSGSVRERLRAAYYDTEDRRLARAGLALRLRQEGRGWVQTLKGAGDHAMVRLEHEVPLARAPRGAAPVLDLSRHDGTPAGVRLASVLGEAGAAGLKELYRTDILRTRRRLRVRGGMVELAFDAGEIRAGRRSWPVCELEIELVSGSPAAVIDVARRWVRRHGLWLDVRTKAERGDRLARGVETGEPVKAAPLALGSGATVESAWRAMLGNCLAQALPNASEVAGGSARAEHLHQLRVGLRRLRSGLRFLEGWLDPVLEPGVAESVSRLFSSLGDARDADVQAALMPELLAAGAPPLPPLRGGRGVDAVELLRETDTTLLWLDLLAWLVKPPAAGSPDAAPARLIKPLAARRLKRWHAQVAEAAGRFDSLADEDRHRLRKRVKRLRYSIEFAGALFPSRRVERYLQRLRPAQESLGHFNDVVVAQAGWRERADDDPRAWFAVGWLAARREAVLGECRAALAPLLLADVPKFWK
nr:CYTH and CHAD domain-containing protein [Methylibium rhizosphaerae]